MRERLGRSGNEGEAGGVEEKAKAEACEVAERKPQVADEGGI